MLGCFALLLPSHRHHEDSNPSSLAALLSCQARWIAGAVPDALLYLQASSRTPGHIWAWFRSANRLEWHWGLSLSMLFALCRYYIFRMGALYSPVETQSKVQSVFSVELPDSSQSLMAKRRGGNLMQLDAIQISACVRRAGRMRRSTVMSVRVGIKRIEQTRKYLLACVVVSLANKSSKLKVSEKRDDHRADLSNSIAL